MADLDDEIARIATLRGRPVEEVKAAARQADTEQRRVSDAQIRDLFSVAEGSYIEDDLEALDELPADLRQAIRDCPLIMSAVKVRALFARTRDAGCIIAGMNDQLPDMLKRFARQHYGREHPAAKDQPDAA